MLIRFKPRDTGQVPFLSQEKPNECALACLAMISSFYGYQLDMPAARRRFSSPDGQWSFRKIIEAAKEINLNAKAFNVDLGKIHNASLPCILHWELDHFVVLVQLTQQIAVVHDPRRGVRRITVEELETNFTGYLIELLPTEVFEKKDERRSFRIRYLLPFLRPIYVILLQTIVISAAFDIISIISQFVMQIIINNVIAPKDKHLLVIVVFVSLSLGALTAILSYIRNSLLNYATGMFTYDLGSNVFKALLEQKYPFFTGKDRSNILQKVMSTSPLRNLLIGGGLSTIIDGTLTSLLAPILFYVSPTVAIITIVSAVVYGGLRYARYLTTKSLIKSGIEYTSELNGLVLESIDTIQSIKILQRYSAQMDRWRHKSSRALGVSMDLNKLSNTYKTFGEALNIFESSLIISILAIMVINNNIQLGAMFTILFLRGLFMQRTLGMIDLAIEAQRVRVYLDDVGEILLGDLEKVQGERRDGHQESGHFQHTLVLQGVSFRYGSESKYLLKDVNVSIPFGKKVLILGKSGGGKSTLLKIVCGLLEPDSGNISVGGSSIGANNTDYIRGFMSAMLQEDELVSGTVLENITHYSNDYNIHDVIAAASMACIHDDISLMSLGYDTLIGQGGISVSSGQKQRILLAKALYFRRPIMLLDEPTANLDPVTEEKIINNIFQLDRTVIISSHRPSMVDLADICLQVDDGNIIHIGKDND
ncbi:MAG: peptidase domain-containing ABC transporter [Paenibacillus polymyxa]